MTRMAGLLVALLLVAPSRAELCDVKAPDGGGVWSVGQGVYVGAGIVLTAKHVIRDARGMPTVSFPSSGATVQVTEWAQSKDYDLAGLIIDAPIGVTATPIAGEWPTGSVRTVRGQGAVIRGMTNLSGREILSWGHPSVEGDSGGPVWGQDGRVYSIVYATDSSRSYGVHPLELPHFVQRWRGVSCQPSGCYAPGTQMASGDPIPPAPRPRTAPAVSLPFVLELTPKPKSKPATKPATKPAYSVSEVAEALADTVLAKLRADQSLRGERGLAGQQGATGPRGPQGEPGPAGKPASDNTKDIVAQLGAVQSRLDQLEQATFRVELIMPDGSTQDGQVSVIGGSMTLDFRGF